MGRDEAGLDAVSTGWFIAIAVATLLVTIRVSGFLTREVAREGMRWCGVCGVEIAEGWVLYEVTPQARVPDHQAAPSRRPVYFCRQHRPADAAATPWRSHN